MEARDILIDGVEQLRDWMADALRDLTPEQLNYVPAQGQCLGIAFNAWHVYRTVDNVVNFVLKREKPTWLAQDYVSRMGGLPKIDQGTSMPYEDARAIRIDDGPLLVEYGTRVFNEALAYLEVVPYETLEEIQLIKPLGEMPKWRVFRETVMTHGFMHLGEINSLRGQLGFPFAF